ncbi:restriction endonuclease subunit S [Agromyces aurantiacus]|uniref:Restriction endonuclease subunit S n=1 Tax=Agromyces aurantiacus TaxID=165814 RepID=A0ABV9R2B4_9MICO|nr:restriction endonuclease subunit S [Agromyces aurantiacus]MBM7502937.1 type I restriction enzyme S subunit [Agromyces aurantiacus]
MTGFFTSSLGELGEAIIGLTYSPAQVSSNGTLVLRSSNIQNGRLSLADTVYVDAPIPEKLRVRESDILICVRNGSRPLIGKSLYLDERVVGETFGAFMTVYRSPMNSYLRFFFQSEAFKRQVDEHLGATINQITNRSLRGFLVSYPSAPERNEISARLTDADHLIASLERVIAKKRAIKQGMMQQLLTGRTRLPGFSSDWPVVPLLDLVSIRNGQVDPRLPEYQSLTLIAPDHVEVGTGRLTARVSAADQRAISGKYLVEAGDIVYGKINPHLKKVVLAEESALCSADMYPLSPRRGIDGAYVFYHLLGDAFTNFAVSLSRRSGIPKINRKELRGYRMPAPSREEQRAIGTALRDVDLEIAVIERRLESTRAIKRGMMQELLTGRTRLSVSKVAA